MKAAILTLFISAVLTCNAGAGSAVYTSLPTGPDSDTKELSAKIGSTMFAYYQLYYQDQIAVITTLRYCGAETVAKKVIESVPDLPSFYLRRSSQQLLYDIVYKEAMINGYDLTSEEDFELISKQSLLTGQSYFSGYLSGYQIAMQKFFDNKVVEPFCQSALLEADKYIRKTTSAQRDN